MIAFDNSYARELPELGERWQPARASAPSLLFFNTALAEELGLDAPALASDAELWSGNRLPAGAEPVAQVYAGHQFGGFSPRLGDGRALLLGELIDRRGLRRDIAFKGSGRTPFSRGGDGKAAVGPMLREVLIGEAMHALGVPSTRALAVAATGDAVQRERVLPGAVLTRVAASHLRVGSFQYPASRGERELLSRLLDYAVARHDPALRGREERAPELLRAVIQRQAQLLAQWMNLGFIHGVMNTDNMTISGETIDYGPCAFMEAYDPATVFSSIDHDGRYAYANQPAIAQWNLARLAESLLPLFPGFDDEAPEPAIARATDLLDEYPAAFDAAWRAGQRRKLGFVQAEADDPVLADDWLLLLHQQRADFTLAWRSLAAVAEGEDAALQALLQEPQAATPWLARWRERLQREPGGAAQRLREANPWIIPRNHRVEEALQAASERGDLAPFQTLLQALQDPFTERAELAHLALPAAPDVAACYQTFCGT